MLIPTEMGTDLLTKMEKQPYTMEEQERHLIQKLQLDIHIF